MYIFDFYFFYLSLKDKVDFDMDMGGRLEGIGVCLVQNGDFVKIFFLIFGGFVWKGKELEVDDFIL